jgi:hypothetical protein
MKDLQNALGFWDRLIAPMPFFFNQLRRFSMVLGGLSFALANFNATLIGMGVVAPDALVTTANALQWVSVGILAVCQLTVDFERYKKENAL